jgi:3-hydroxyisobutyrate dehydrogenase-like beta-hydroxyacid dehydrogenase
MHRPLAGCRSTQNRIHRSVVHIILKIMNVAFIGLGNMGSPMARNLLQAGHQVTVFNRTREKASAIGGRVGTSPADVCRDNEAVFTMLADDQAVEEVFFGRDGLLSGLKPETIHISSSTISTALVRRLAAAHQATISAPVFGRPEAAESKRLLVVAAGQTALVERCRPLFDAIGRATFVAGAEPWQANAVKVCGNFMIASMLETFGEAFATLRKAKVDPHLFLEVMNALFASPVYANYGRMAADQQFEPAGFALRLGLKDVRLALQTAEECVSPMPLASLLRDQFLDAMAHGQESMDWSSVVKAAARGAGLD